MITVCVCSVTQACDPMDYSPQAPMSVECSRQEYRNGSPCPLARGSSWPRDWTHISCVSYIGRRIISFHLFPAWSRPAKALQGCLIHCPQSNSSAVSSSWRLCGNGLIRNQRTEEFTFGREEAEVCRMGCFPGGQVRAPVSWQEGRSFGIHQMWVKAQSPHQPSLWLWTDKSSDLYWPYFSITVGY